MIWHADPCKLCMHHSLQSGWPEKGLQKDKRQTQKNRWSGSGFTGLMNLAECRTITAQRLPFPGRFGWRFWYVFRLWRCGDHLCNALIRLESTGAVQVSALVITLFHLFGHIAARFGMCRTFAVRAVHHFWLPS